MPSAEGSLQHQENVVLCCPILPLLNGISFKTQRSQSPSIHFPKTPGGELRAGHSSHLLNKNQTNEPHPESPRITACSAPGDHGTYRFTGSPRRRAPVEVGLLRHVAVGAGAVDHLVASRKPRGGCRVGRAGREQLVNSCSRFWDVLGVAWQLEEEAW